MAEQQKSPKQANTEEQKLTPAELKKRAKAEKQARRAAAKESQGEASGGPPPTDSGGANGERRGPKQGGVTGPSQQKAGHKQGDPKQGSGQQTSIPVRTRPGSQGGPSIGGGGGSNGGAPKEDSKVKVKPRENKQVQLFSHLYTQPRRQTTEGASKDIHPAVLALGFKMSNYEICGSSARCVAMLTAFKEAIQQYTTPTGTSLARHLTSHYLSPQIDFLKSCRPISESMGNAIRWLKKLIVEIDPNTPEQEAKDYLCEYIDRFIQERIIVTDQVIASSASALIKDGTVVLTYAKSSIVEKTILKAHAAGVKFRVVVVDSRPLFEGKNLARTCADSGIQVDYLPFCGISRAVAEATVVLLGAHAMLSNGRLQSRVGTAAVAIAARRADIPVIVCCESVKFSGKVALDSIVLNEVAPPEELLSLPPSANSYSGTTKADKADENEEVKSKSIHDWRDVPNLQILNVMYDVTPAECIRMVICEYGNVPPSSVPVVHRLANEGM